MRVSPPNASVKDALFAVLVFNAPYLSFRAEQADVFSFAFAPANASACAVEESLLSCAFLDWPHSDARKLERYLRRVYTQSDGLLSHRPPKTNPRHRPAIHGDRSPPG